MPKMTTEKTKLKEGALGLNYPMLARSNYTAWSLKMKTFMKAHGVWDAVEISKGDETAVDEKHDQIALAVIYQSIPEDILLSVAEKKTAKEAWEAIRTMCQGADRVKKAKVQTLKSEFETLRMKESDQLDDFCMKLNGLVTNIRALGEGISESYVVKRLLRAMPSKYLQIVSTIEQFGDFEKMTVEEAVGSLKAHEERIRGQNDGGGGQLMLTEEEWSKRENTGGKLLLTREEWMSKTNKNGGEGSGTQKNRWADSRGRNGGRGTRDKSTVKCYNCGVYGHFAYECRKPRKEKEYKPEVNMTQAEEDEPALLLMECDDKKGGMVLLNEEKVDPVLSKRSEEKKMSQMWYLDNGASQHMTGDRGKFKELDERITGQVKFGDGSTVTIRGKGVISFMCKNGEEWSLRDVYYIPTLCNNILSLGQLSEEGSKVILEEDELRVYNQGGALLMRVQRSANRLYKISLEESKPVCGLSKVEEETWLWHNRLGHVNFKAMELMSREELALGIPKFMQPKKNCEGCLMSKQARKPFPSQALFIAKKPLELIYADICGPISPSTLAGNKYFLLFVDDCTRKMWVYMLKTKGEAFETFKKFKALVERGTESKIKILRTDRGGEFCSLEFRSFCDEVGIQRHYTAPYSPQQNGVVERRNRTVAAMTRSILKSSNMPSYMWGEAVRHSVYLLNRLPTKVLKGRTPHEAWSGRKPDLSHIKMFGCVAYMKTPSVHTSKLDDRSKMVVYLGKEPGTKASRLYDPNHRTLHVSRDIVFQERKFWSWEETEGRDVKFPEIVDPSAGNVVVQTTHQEDVQDSSDEYEPATSTQSSIAQTSDSNASVESAGSTAGSTTTSSTPRNFRLLSDIYDDTEQLEIADDLLLLSVEEPSNFEEASQEIEWKKAMESELESIEKNKTWVLTELPPGHRAIGLKWVYKIKRDANGVITKYKTRLVAKGYVQKQGIDFEEAFAPVTRLETVRLLLALAARNGWVVHHLDVKSAFLNGDIQEEVYVKQPQGYEKKNEEYKVYKLLKALYGLRQAPRAWYARLKKFLEELGFVKCPYEHAVYTKREGDESLIVGVYVDDLLVTGTNVANIIEFKEQMRSEFDMSDLGKLAYYLGIEVEQRKGCIELKQTAYAKKLLE